jgi:hypothetical protein
MMNHDGALLRSPTRQTCPGMDVGGGEVGEGQPRRDARCWRQPRRWNPASNSRQALAEANQRCNALPCTNFQCTSAKLSNDSIRESTSLPPFPTPHPIVPSIHGLNASPPSAIPNQIMQA